MFYIITYKCLSSRLPLHNLFLSKYSTFNIIKKRLLPMINHLKQDKQSTIYLLNLQLLSYLFVNPKNQSK